MFLLLEGLRSRGHRSILAAPPESAALAEALAFGKALVATTEAVEVGGHG